MLRIYLLTIVLLTLLSNPIFAEDPYHWYYYTVDSIAIQAYSEIAFNSQGKLGIAYRRANEVYYAELGNHVIKTEVAGDSTGGDAKIAFSFDRNDRPHILYHNDVYKIVYLASKSGTAWSKQTVDYLNSTSIDWYQLDMIASPIGGLHLIYNRRNAPADNSLNYTFISETGQKSDTGFITGTLNGKWNSIALDQNNKPVVSYYRHTGNSLDVATRTGTAWQANEVSDGINKNPEGFYVSLKHDTGNVFFMSYRTKTTSELRLLKGSPGGTWEDQLVDASVLTTLFNSPSVLGLGANHSPYIAYAVTTSSNGIGATTSKLMLAHKVGSSWIKEIVDSSGVVGEFLSLAMSPTGLPAISYYDRSKGRLRLAVARTEAPVDTNNNGIPDYRETVSVLTKSHRLPKPSGALVDTRKVDLLGRILRENRSIIIPL